MKKYHTIVVGYVSGFFEQTDAGYYDTLEEALRFPDLKEDVAIINYFVYDENGRLVS